MDSLTHIALGACIGEVFAGKQLGRKALFWGAFVQSIPDIDFMAAAWTCQAENLLAHRGFTHSILFAVVFAPLLALLAEKWHRAHTISWRKWMWFFLLQMGIHLLIDGMNVYGAGWYEPFSHVRVAWNWIYVADPLFSIWPGIAIAVLVFLKRNHPQRKIWARAGIITSTVYLLYCGWNKWDTDKAAREIFAEQGITYSAYFTTPSPLNNWLWYMVAATDSGYYTGYRSVFEKNNRVVLQYIPRNEALMGPYLGRTDLYYLRRFSQGYYALSQRGDTILFNDLRFGEQIGWQRQGAPFVFYYYLNYPEDNRLLVQRGRFAGWDQTAFRSLLNRIRGKQLITPGENKK